MRYQVPMLAGCPPGYFAPSETMSLKGYNAYGSPVVMHDTGERMSHIAGGIFPGRGRLDGLGSVDVGVWISQAATAGEAFLRQQWAAMNPGKPAPADPAAAKRAEDEAKRAAEAAAGQSSDLIFGIPAPVAIGGGLIAAALLWKGGKRSNPGRRRRR